MVEAVGDRKWAFLNIDYTVDFVDAQGALTCGEPGIALHDAMAEVTEKTIENGVFTVFGIDLHLKDDQYHPETKLFPPHNIKGTSGRDLYGKLEAIYQENRDKENVYYMDKTRYSAFAGTDLELKLRERGIDTVLIAGVCTNICVLHTAIDAYNRGINIVIAEDLVASFNPQGHDYALTHLKNTLNATIVK
ncbi:isochorismatase [Ammoniphilus oxalaticus]|uniref:Isochorismatase n=1 Tax=Ammoniphilus oxalaticus TaxID=66863 RepID=A0A419SF69_9BACL|nr:isochorismatase [Ammoniphilus oxalaticus]